MRFAFIQELDEEEQRKARAERIPVSLMCEVLEVSRSGFYAWAKRGPSAREKEDAELRAIIIDIHQKHKGRLGIGRLVVELAKLGRFHSHKRVRRLARAAGLRCVHPRPYRAATVRAKGASFGLVDLVRREFVPAGPNQLWYTDITYIRCWDRWAYLVAIIDGYSRKVVGWSLADHMRTSLVTDALSMAIDQQRPGIGECVIHSDRGSQFTSSEFRELAFANGIIPSVGHTGSCYDNAMAESFNATIKKELIHLHTWPTIAKLKAALFEYIESYYNRIRPHTSIDNRTPCEMENYYRQELDNEIRLAA